MDPDEPLDAERIFEVLAEHAVEYVLVGGLAVQTHGHVRTTIDVDVFPRPDRSNLARLADALNELGARVPNPGSEGLAITAAMLPRTTMWHFATRHGAIDVLHDARALHGTRICAAERWRSAWGGSRSPWPGEMI
jgi:hypothetical protein